MSENQKIREVSRVMAKAIKEKTLQIQEDGTLSGDTIIDII